MKISSTRERALAIAAGLAFTTGGLTILLGPVLLTPQAWASYHVLTILTVFGTIAAGHLTKTAWSARAVLSCAGFAVLFLTGTALVVYNSVGRQAEAHDTVALEAKARNSLIEDKRQALDTARERQAKAQANADRERGSKCRQRCRDWEDAAKDAARVIAVLESEIKTLGAPVPVDAKAGKAGELAAVFGFDRQQAEAAAALIEPFLWTIFFEIGSIVSLGFAFRSTPVAVAVDTANDLDVFRERFLGPLPETVTGPTIAERLPASFPPPESEPPKPGKRAPAARLPENVVELRPAATHPVIAALENVGGSVASNRQLAALMGVTDGEATKRRAEVAHLLVEHQVGKERRIALR